jgi:hypothetical protein
MNEIERYNFWHFELDTIISERKKYNNEIELVVERVKSGLSVSDEEVWKELDNEKGAD